MSTEAKDRVHRLLDIVVEEVSLVDRAANKHRFLIVKRSNEMDETTNGTGAAPDQEEPGSGNGEAPETTETLDAEEAPGSHTGEESGEALGIALEALEELTGVVERLGAAHGEEARAALPDLAADLQSAAERLATLAGVADGEEDEEGEPQGSSTGSGDLADVVAEVRTALRQVGSLLEAGEKGNGRAVGTPPAASPAKPPASTTPGQPGADGAGGLQQELAALTSELRAIAGTVREQQQRLARLEKRSGLPNSTPPGEGARRPAEEEEVSWPFDLNRRCDRESVDKAVSFHEP